MTEDEVDAVAQELAKVGGSSWYPGRTSGPLLRPVRERYKDRARVAIAALDRFRAAKQAAVLSESAPPPQDTLPERSDSGHQLQVGMIVVYRAPGDQRATSCRIERIEADQAYLVPLPQPTVGWVSLKSLQPLNPPATPTPPGNPAD